MVCFTQAHHSDCLHLAYILRKKNGKYTHLLLFSTNIAIVPRDIYRYYSASFQIEFIFRDARQFTGLADGQARNTQALDSHVNTSLFALNLAKAELRQDCDKIQPMIFSMASLKRLALNEHMLDLFISMFELDSTLIKSQTSYQSLLEYGTITY